MLNHSLFSCTCRHCQCVCVCVCTICEGWEFFMRTAQRQEGHALKAHARAFISTWYITVFDTLTLVIRLQSPLLGS